MRRTALRSAALVSSVAAVLAVAACGDSSDDDNPTASPSTPTTVDQLTLPDPIGDLDTFLAAMNAAGGCSDELVEGVSKIVTFAGGQVSSSRSSADPSGIPSCTFDIDAGTAKLVPTIVVAGLPASKNTVISPTAAAAPTSTTLSVGNDKIGQSVQEIAETNITETGYDPRKDPIAGSAGTGGEQINIILQTVAVAGVTAGTSGTQPVPGYYVVAENPGNTNTSMLTLNPRNYIDEWFQGELTNTSFN